MAVASEYGGYLVRDSVVRPVKGGRYPCWRAVAKVERAGEKRDAWAKATRSAGVDRLLIAGRARAGRARAPRVGKTVVQRLLVAGLRVPWMVAWLGQSMVHVVALRWAVQPESQSWPTESRESLRAGKMWVCLAADGRPSKGSSAVCVECMNSWLATWTGRGSGVGLMLSKGAPMEK
jgi:hypothetical protein